VLVADHDAPALIVGKTIGSLMIMDGPDKWFKLSRISRRPVKGCLPTP
jgi:hypothetical protein